MNPVDMALRSALAQLIRLAGVPASLGDGTTVRGILEAESPEEAEMRMQGGINTAATQMYTFQTLTAIPVGLKQVTIEGRVYNVTKCQRGQGCYTTSLLLKETK